MAVRARIDPIETDLAILFPDTFSLAAKNKAFAEFARRALAEAQDQNRQVFGAVPPHDTFVDGRKGAPLESVKPDGVIVFQFELLTEAFEWIDDMLILHSPSKSGRYAKSHVFLADGREADPFRPPQGASEFVFINRQPYARKIERGQSPQAPEGVYDVVAILAQQRFGNMARIRFSYRTLISGSKARTDRQPAIVITPR
jgi:hypothetical protein